MKGELEGRKTTLGREMLGLKWEQGLPGFIGDGVGTGSC